MNNILDELRAKIESEGFEQEDKRLNRKVKSIPGHFIIITGEALDSLKVDKPLEKYGEDWKRMYSTFKLAVKTAQGYKDSRRLMVLNDSRYAKIFQCFTHLQFVYTHRNEFDMYVYLRSSDLDKLKDDLVFFSHVMKKFESKVKIPTTKLVVIFGNVHFEVK